MRRLPLVLAVLSLAVLLAGCGSRGVTTPAPETVIGSLPKAAEEPATPAFKLKGDSTKGNAVFASSGCGNCHTLAAAKSTGTIGPNLDSLEPDYRAVTAQVTNGGAAMPSFKKSLNTQQIADVAAYVVDSTGGKTP